MALPPVRCSVIKGLIFDMDGLMIDSERLYFEVERDMAARFDRTVDERILWRMMGRSPQEGLKIFVGELDLPLSVDEAIEMRNSLMRHKLRTELVPMPGLFDIVETFHGRLKLAVCTGAQSEFLDIVMEGLGLRDRFSVLQHSDGIDRGKPDPEIYLLTCGKMGLAPADCVVLEDSSNGALAGKRAGCTVIAVPSDYTRGQDFGFVDHLASNLAEAGAYILNLTS